MLDEAVIQTQLDFYRRGGAGCLFAAHAAGDANKYGWRMSVESVDKASIEARVASAIAAPNVSLQSIIFPSIVTDDHLLDLLAVLNDSSSFLLELTGRVEESVCLGYRVKIDDAVSWVTGFGSFDFFPETRQATFVEIVFRTKPRPDYATVMKEAPVGVLHLADLEMKGMGKNKFMSLWYGSLDNTEKVLGCKPDLRSAAKTTFAIPLALAERTGCTPPQ